MQRGRQGVEITSGLRHSPVLLRRGVPLGADHRAPLAVLKDLGDAKVDDHDAAIGPDHQVGWFHVPENHGWLVVVQKGQDVADLDSPFDRFFLAERLVLLLQNTLQAVSFDKLQDQIAAVPLGKVVKDLGDGGMGEAGQDVCLPLKVLDADPPQAGVGCGVGHLLNGDDLVHRTEPQVACPVDGSHASQPLHGQDLIPFLQDGPCRQCALGLNGGWSLFDCNATRVQAAHYYSLPIFW
jgi:hypothetical protein